jgi:hypothetical protein
MINIETKPGYLYLLRNTLLGGYKIGITTAPASRFKALAVGEKTEIVGYWQHDGYRELEKHFHKEYKEQRCPQSEWFKLDESMVQSIVEQMHSSAVTQYLEPGLEPAFVGSSFRFVTTPPHLERERSPLGYYGLLVVAASLAFLLGSALN